VTDPAPELDPGAALDLLTRGDIEVAGALVDASNATLFAQVELDGATASCVYKPVAGERPLWDFPRSTLGRREVAAYELSQAGGWGVVPPTVFREGPFGPGSLQLWIYPDPLDDLAGEPGAGLVDVVPAGRVPTGWLRVLDAYGGDGQPVSLVHRDDEALASMAVFDVVANNADRKGGHVLRGPGGALYGVDHGLVLHDEPKLRTVLWGWAGRPLPGCGVERLERCEAALGGEAGRRLARLVSPAELGALRSRVGRLARVGRFPRPRQQSPAIPWPPF
jgi:uncharacterized repeat protein (TIGR03843 family)